MNVYAIPNDWNFRIHRILQDTGRLTTTEKASLKELGGVFFSQ